MNVKKYFDFDGISIPYYPNDSVTVLGQDDIYEIRDVEPNYITHFKKFLTNNSNSTLGYGLLSLRKQILLSMVKELTHRFVGYEAPIAVSNVIPLNCVYIDYKNERIVMNESQGIMKNIDADGDRAALHTDESNIQGCMVKYPVTSVPMILKILDKMPETKFSNFTSKDARKTIEANPIKRYGINADLEAVFVKRHLAVDVGVMTSLWNNQDLWDARDLPYEAKLQYLFNSYLDESGIPLRARDIEDTGMKAVRKDNKSHETAAIYKLHNGKVLDHKYAWALTSCSSIGGMKEYQTDWIDGANLKSLIHQEILPLKLTSKCFRKTNPKPRKDKPSSFKEWNLIPRLKNLGLIQYFELPHHSPDLPPSVMFFLTAPGGKAVGLTDIKREGRDEGLTYAFLLAPVYDNLTLYDEDENVIEPASNQWVHPIEHMQKVFSTFDTTIRANSSGPVLGHFPRDLRDFLNPARKEKEQLLYKAFCDYCGRYGDPAPATIKDNVIDLSMMGKQIIKRTVVIDYGSELNEQEMFVVAKRAHKKHPFCLGGSKSTSRRIRKYMLSNEHGGTIVDLNGNSSLYRGACLRSQLQRSIKSVEMTVAIVQFPTPFGTPFVTPSGIEKQMTDSVFLPQCFNTLEAYEDYLQAFNIDAEEFPATIVDYVTWTGEQRRCWTTSARRTIKIGKLVDGIGNKFMPLGYGQAHAISDYVNHNSIEVDLIFPINELVNKDTHHELLSKAVDADLYLPNGDIVKCMLCTHKFYRTGDASENVPARKRICSYKGMDAIPIVSRIQQVEQSKSVPPDLTDALELQEALRAIGKKYGVLAKAQAPKPLLQPIAPAKD